MLFLSDFGQHIASPSHSLVFLGDACAEFNKPDSDVRRAKVEKKVTIKPFLRKGKMVKSFRRRQKVNQGKNGLRNKALIGLGLAAAVGVGGLATAKLVKKARVNKLAASARSARRAAPTTPPVTKAPGPASVKPSSQPAPNSRADIPEEAKGYLDAVGYRAPETNLLESAKKPASNRAIIDNPQNDHALLLVPNHVGYVGLGGKNIENIRPISLMDNLYKRADINVAKHGAVAQFLELEDGSGFIMRVQKNQIINPGADDRPGGFFFDFFIPKDIDPRFIDLKPFDDILTPGGSPYNKDLDRMLLSGRAKGVIHEENPAYIAAHRYIYDELKKHSWKPTQVRNPRIKSVFDSLKQSKRTRGMTFEEKIKSNMEFWSM